MMYENKLDRCVSQGIDIFFNRYSTITPRVIFDLTRPIVNIHLYVISTES